MTLFDAHNPMIRNHNIAAARGTIQVLDPGQQDAALGFISFRAAFPAAPGFDTETSERAAAMLLATASSPSSLRAAGLDSWSGSAL